jgi:hypothetical protein
MRTAPALLATSIVALSTLATSAHAGELPPAIALTRATITADNHYALFTGIDTFMIRIGHNELGPGGMPGRYNWSLPETYTFPAGPFIYIAAWSDDSVAQGLLAQITRGDETFHSGDPRWQVYTSGDNRGDNDPAPTAAEIIGHVATANAGSLWQTPFVGASNGASPWGTIPGISTNIPWMWAPVAGVADPTQGGRNAGELLIFRMNTVPTPGAAALIGLGGLAMARRRR